MKTSLVFAIVLALGGASADASADSRCYELRIYHAMPGKLEALEARFRDHTCALFEKHGFANVGYWVPMENSDNKLIYIISSPNRELHGKSWQSFAADPDWKSVVQQTEADGKLVARIESMYLNVADFSPEIAPSQPDTTRVFELRTYTPAPEKMDALLARFRDHTLKLFEKHGMTNIGYWTRADKENDQLIYILAHKSKEDGLKSFDAFRADPEWIEAKKASEISGTLTAKVESIYLKPLDFSAIK